MDAWKLFCCTLGVSICVICLFTCRELEWMEGAGPSVQIGDRNHFVPPANFPPSVPWPECRTALFLDAHIHTHKQTELNCKGTTDMIVHVGGRKRYPPALAKYGRHKEKRKSTRFFFADGDTDLFILRARQSEQRGERERERSNCARSTYTVGTEKREVPQIHWINRNMRQGNQLRSFFSCPSLSD